MRITASSTEVGTSKGPADWFTGDVYIEAAAAGAAGCASCRGRVAAPRGDLDATQQG